MEEESPTDEGMDPPRTSSAPAAQGYAEQVPDGAGSVEGMAADPVAVAASNNPLLKTLTAAVSGQLNPKVDLVDTLNGDEFTVFAPVDDAFAAAAQEDREGALAAKNADMLSTVLTYHVCPARSPPTRSPAPRPPSRVATSRSPAPATT